ncbi:hypothetical protein R4Z10_07685 [Niallia sp. XMNu-256]|uniref:hypothetical protein n=1 Tax=Niallia sp. XMNu-256 TaxID=3082444 RepID=UPI0030D2D83C
MKKYFVFIISLILLYTAYQILSGMILTAFYTPDFSLIEGNLNQSVDFGEVTSIPLFVTLFISIFAYFLSQKVFKIEKVDLIA